MRSIIKFEDVENNIIDLREQKVILDSDVAKIYRVETCDSNKAFKDNSGNWHYKQTKK